jgi:hypothetical protein
MQGFIRVFVALNKYHLRIDPTITVALLKIVIKRWQLSSTNKKACTQRAGSK